MDLADFYPANQDEWIGDFVAWIGALNRAHACAEWWAHTVTAKNLLSSPFGNWLLQAFAVRTAIEASEFTTLYVIGATAAQARAVSVNSDHALCLCANRLPRERKAMEFLLRLAYQFARVLLCCIVLPWKFRPRPNPDLCVFTYIDGSVRENTDAFFGNLATHIREIRSDIVLDFVAFLHSPFLATFRKLQTIATERYIPLFAALKVSDLIWALKQTVASFRRIEAFAFPPYRNLRDADGLFKDAMYKDVVNGGYFFNLLVFRAAIRYAGDYQPKKLLYPYENKSLEKLLVSGFRAGHPGCRVDGYQHTSITPRHVTLLFAPDEAAITPLPDRILTAGPFAKHYLEQKGNYPPTMIHVACALRQSWTSTKFETRRNSSGAYRLLLALSSSRRELLCSVAFLQHVVAIADRKFEILVRPHPEFGLSLLPPVLKHWVTRRCHDGTGSPLASNLAWCDATVYVSSTVALEALMLGKPVINLDIGEPITPDPVMGELAFHGRVKTPADFPQVVERWQELTTDALDAMRTEARHYVENYFNEVTAERVSVFLE